MLGSTNPYLDFQKRRRNLKLDVAEITWISESHFFIYLLANLFFFLRKHRSRVTAKRIGNARRNFKKIGVDPSAERARGRSWWCLLSVAEWVEREVEEGRGREGGGGKG